MGRYGGLEGNEIYQFLYLECVVPLKELILTVSTVGRYPSLEITDFNSFYLGQCGGLERTEFLQFLIFEALTVLKELILKVSMLGGCGGLKRTHF